MKTYPTSKRWVKTLWIQLYQSKQFNQAWYYDFLVFSATAKPFVRRDQPEREIEQSL